MRREVKQIVALGDILGWCEPARHALQIDPFRQGQRIIEVNAETAHSAVHFGMPKQKLNSTQVAGLLVNPGDLGAPHRMRAIGAGFQPDREHPVAHDPGILPRGQVWTGMETAGPEVFATHHFRIVDPSLQRLTCRVGDLEADKHVVDYLVRGREPLGGIGPDLPQDLYGCEIIAEKVSSHRMSAETENPELVDRDDEIPL